ncbi:hypothetical protein [Nocardioides bigeumensis]|jgi:hypothetical protein|uniref:DUF4287 domain-containing protein n=1 Tax=Nocardioides bigeumensis TaxID=433657 RepID=A0ABP5KR27_9ACTN
MAQHEPGTEPPLATSDERIRERTGLGWEQWFDLLDGSVSPAATRREIARWVADYLDVDPLAWNAQAVTRGYEVARRGRLAGRHEHGFTATASRTVGASPERVFELLDEWLAGAPLVVRSVSRPRSARYEWTEDRSRVSITLDAKDGGIRCLVGVSHAKLSDAAAYETRKAWWRERLLVLKASLEAGDHDG